MSNNMPTMDLSPEEICRWKMIWMMALTTNENEAAKPRCEPALWQDTVAHRHKPQSDIKLCMGDEILWLGACKEKISLYLFFFFFFLLCYFPIINGITRSLKCHEVPDLNSESKRISKMNSDQNTAFTVDAVACGKGIEFCALDVRDRPPD